MKPEKEEMDPVVVDRGDISTVDDNTAGETGDLSLPQMLKHARRQSVGSRSVPEVEAVDRDDDDDDDGEDADEKGKEKRQTRRHSLRALDSQTPVTCLSIFDEIGDERGSLESLVFPMSYWRISTKEPSRDASMSPFSRIRTDIEQFVDSSEKELEARLLMMPGGLAFGNSSITCGSPLVGPSITSLAPGGGEGGGDSTVVVSMMGTARTVWVGGFGDGVGEAELDHLFSNRIGPVEAVRLITSKRCAFVTMREQADVDRAIELLNGHVELGGEILRVGYAKQTPSISSTSFGSTRSSSLPTGLPNPSTLDTSLPGDAPVELDLTHIFAPTLSDPLRHHHHTPTHRRSSVASVLMSTVAAAATSTKDPLSFTQQQQPASPPPVLLSSSNTDFAQVLPTLPPPYFGPDLTPARIRDYRRHIESPACKPSEFDLIAMELLPVLVAASTDPVGNVLVQKLIERGSDELKGLIIGELADYLAAIGVHKNGTWVVQKLINWCHLPLHQEMVAEALRPYMVALMQDQFGNYVVQCCLQFFPPRNSFIAESLCRQCLAIATSRFGSRAMRSCLESPHTTAKAIKAIAMAVIENAEALLCDPNGSIVIQWLLDSDLPGRFTMLQPALKTSLPFLVTQRFAGNILGKIFTQTAENEARNELLEFFLVNPEEPQSILQAFLREPANVPVALRLLSTTATTGSVQRLTFLNALRKALRCLPVTQHPHLQRLWDELSAPSAGPSPQSIGKRTPSHGNLPESTSIGLLGNLKQPNERSAESR